MASVIQINGIPVEESKIRLVFEKLITLWIQKVDVNIKELIINSAL